MTRQNNINRYTIKYKQIPYSSNLYLLKVKCFINPCHKYDFLLDTGAPISIISPAVAEILDIREQDYIRQVRLASLDNTRGGIYPTTNIQIELAKNYELKIPDFEMAIMPLPHKEFSGILGINFFELFTTVFKIDQNKLILQQASE